MYSQANEKKLDELISHYPVKRSAVLPALFIAQEEHGYVTDDDVKYLAERLDMRINEVEEVVTFYTMYARKPIGKYKLQVCRTGLLHARPGRKKSLNTSNTSSVAVSTRRRRMASSRCWRSNVSAIAILRRFCR
jgi:NADH:ubiquinone oxidoreductase subunit E